MTNTIAMKREQVHGLEKAIAEAPKRKKSSLILGGLAALALAACGIAAGGYAYNEHLNSPEVVAAQFPEDDIGFLYWDDLHRYFPEWKSRLPDILSFARERYGLEPNELSHVLVRGPRKQVNIVWESIKGGFSLAYAKAYVGINVEKDGSLTESYHFFPDDKQREIIEVVRKHIIEAPFTWKFTSGKNKEKAYDEWLERRKRNPPSRDDYLMVYDVKSVEEKCPKKWGMHFDKWEKPQTNEVFVIYCGTPLTSYYFVDYGARPPRVIGLERPM